MIAAFLLLAGWATGVGADEATKDISSQTADQKPVAVGEVAPVTIIAGSAATIHVPVCIADGYRVQANPSSNEFLVPLEIRIEDLEGIVFGPAAYPEGRPYRLEGTDEDLSTYVADFEIAVPVSVSVESAEGRHRVSGVLHYQACNSRMCLFPSSVPVTLHIDVR